MLNSEYWNNKYNENQIGWDIGGVSQPLKVYIDQLENKDIKVLFPGAGHAYDAEYMFNLGFKNVYVADFAQTAADNFFERVPNFPKKQFIVGDFFKISQSFDLVLEQTFFCAIQPEMRATYISKMNEVLTSNGKLTGVLFNFPLTEKGPPFGGSVEEYQESFSNKFEIKTLEDCHNSIPERSGNEVFIILKKKGV